MSVSKRTAAQQRTGAGRGHDWETFKPKPDASPRGGTWTIIDAETASEYIANLASELDYIKLELNLSIGCLLANGWSWQTVGDALGVRRQSAQERFSHARKEYESYCESSREGDSGEALRRRIGVKSQRIVFEVREGGELVTRHYKFAQALGSYRIHSGDEHGELSIWKVYPDGTEKQVR